MSKHESELPCLPAPDESFYRNGEVVATVDIPSQTYTSEGAKPTVYGRDLNSSDLLLLGVNKSLKQIMSREYGIDEEFGWEYPEAFSTTSRKVIIQNGVYKYFVK